MALCILVVLWVVKSQHFLRCFYSCTCCCYSAVYAHMTMYIINVRNISKQTVTQNEKLEIHPYIPGSESCGDTSNHVPLTSFNCLCASTINLSNLPIPKAKSLNFDIFILFHTTFDVCTSSVFHSYISNYTCILLSPDLHHSLPFPQFLAPHVFPVLLSSASKAKKSFKVVMEGVALRHNSTCFSVKWGICNNLSVTVCNPSSWRISKEKPLWRSMSIQNHKKRTVLCSQLQVANDHSKLVWPSKKTVDKEYYDRT